MGNLADYIRYTYADYIRWNDDTRYELIDGVAYAMASSSVTHQIISKKIFKQLDNFLTGKSCEVFYAPLAVRLNFNSFDDVVVEPDLFVVCDKSKLDGTSVKGTPDFIIEILPPSSKAHDTIRKFRQYQRAGVKEYWIVDPFTKTVQVYILEGDRYSKGIIYRDDDIISVHVLDGCEINLVDVFYDIESEDDSEARIKQKIIEAMKAKGISEEDIRDIIKNFD